MSCQPAARKPKPLSHRLEQDSRAVKSLHTRTHNPQIAAEAQIRAEGESRPRVCGM